MRKAVLPVLVFSAVGALIVVWMRLDDGSTPVKNDPPPRETPTAEAEEEGGLRPVRRPDVQVDENEALSELQRVLQRKDLSHAWTFRNRVCEQIDAILANDRLRSALLQTIREHGIESDDARKRDVLLPILRVFRDPEATAMIEQEYYRARSADERMLLLEAMAHEYHNPQQASVWAIDTALHAESAEHREHAFAVIREFSRDDELVFDTAVSIYESTTSPAQSAWVLEAISQRGRKVEKARAWMRQRLQSPRADEMHEIVARMDSWGNEKDAAYLEQLALEMPQMGDFLRERAEGIRMARRLESADPDAVAEAEADRARRLAEQAKKDAEGNKEASGS